MANEILFPANAVGNFKAIVAKGGNVWNGSAMVPITAAAKVTGAALMSRQGTTLEYVANFPSAIAVPGTYTILIVDAISLTGNEPVTAFAEVNWNGVAEVVFDDIAPPAIKVVTDKLNYMISGATPNYVYTGSALINAPAATGGGAITLDMTQPVPIGGAPGTVGEALEAARAQGFGKWVKNGTILTIYAPDGTTVVRTFTLDDAVAPTSRT